MEMDQFFEAWVETIFQAVARHNGAEFLVGRRRQTVHAINWDPVYVGSQKSLIPDIWLEWESMTVIVDAKYKRHWEELQYQPWSAADELLCEHHRSDLLQVLAYATLSSTKNVVSCLVYPCSAETWNSLRERRRLIHKAVINVGARTLHLWFAAIPMAASSDQIALLFSRELHELVRSNENGPQEASYGRH
jgi:5-methylcytosine-specific restriction endonuclease McrBC regulatory subunit McrC